MSVLQMSAQVDQPDSEGGRLDCLGESDEAFWNENVAEPRQVCLHDVVSFQATRRPSNQAVCAVGGNLTYVEIDRLSSGLAANLAKGGHRQGSIIPLCFRKSQ